MAESSVFDWICHELEASSSLDRLEARGTIRIALKQAGLEARSVDAAQLEVILAKILPPELEARGIADAASVCRTLAAGLESAGFESASEHSSPDEIFRRLGGRNGR